MKIDGVQWSLSSLAQSAEDEVPIGHVGRNVIATLNQLETSSLKRDLEALSKKVAADKRAATDKRIATRWECVATALDAYYYQYCLNPARGDVLLNRDGMVVGALGSLINADGKIVGWIDRATVAKAKGMPKDSVGQNFASALLDSVSPQELGKAESELLRRVGVNGPAAAGGWLFPVSVGLTVWGFVKNRLAEEYDYRTGYDEVHENRRHVNQMRSARGLPPI
ncbi:MAG TPA: hypothetical protein VEC06_07320 [Paucimonas sp.]|nr:hypothetical protein [Paucimonas sp.]